MATTENRTATTGSDDAAIAELHEIVERQRAAFLADPFPSLEERQELLGALAGMLMSHRTQIEEAMSSDFGVHPTLATDLIEVLGVAGRAALRGRAARRVDGARAAPRDPALYGQGRAFVQPQPKGVVGNIVPWNFPFDLSVGPLVEMLAAGNRVVIKPSEYTPACAELLRDMVRADVRPRPRRRRRRRPRARAGVHPRALGPPALHGQPGDRPRDREGGGRAARAGDARAGRQVPGDPRRGQRRRRVGQAGARRPRRSRTGRCASRSTTAWCRASDGGLRAPGGRPRAREHARLLPSRRAAPGSSPTATSSGSRACSRTPGRAAATCGRSRRRARSIRTPASCRCRSCIDPPDDLALMQEEIFGPILPVKAYDELDEAIEYVNAGERPLALYVFAKDEDVADDVLRRTTSGGACVNSAAVHGALPVAAVRRHRPERLGPPPRHRGLPRVLQPARGLRPRRGRPDRGVRAALRAGGAGRRRRGVRRHRLSAGGNSLDVGGGPRSNGGGTYGQEPLRLAILTSGHRESEERPTR